MSEERRTVEQVVREVFGGIYPEERRWIGMLTEIAEGTIAGEMLLEMVLTRVPLGTGKAEVIEVCARLLKQLRFTYSQAWQLTLDQQEVGAYSSFCNAQKQMQRLRREGLTGRFAINKIERRRKRK